MFTLFHVTYETPGGVPGGAPPVAPAPAAPSTAPSGRPAPVPGQAPQAQPRSEGFWRLFPNVPAEQRPQLEPHIREMQRHVTQLEQRTAAFKGYTPTQVQGLANFAKQFDANPMAMWLQMAAGLQQRGILHEDLDLEALQAVVRGEDPDNGQGFEQEGELPEWAQPLMQFKDEYEQSKQQEQQRAVEKTQDEALAKQLMKFQQELKAAGIPEQNLLPEKKMLAALLMHNGNLANAVREEVEYRNSLLKGVTQTKDPLEVDKVPPHTKQPKRNSRSFFGDASVGAEQYLRQAAKEAQ